MLQGLNGVRSNISVALVENPIQMWIFINDLVWYFFFKLLLLKMDSNDFEQIYFYYLCPYVIARFDTTGMSGENIGSKL